MEIEFLHEKIPMNDPKLLMEHIQRMASGEAPFFATTLSLVHDKLIEKAFAKPVPSGSGLGKSAEVQSVADPRSPLQASTSVPSVPIPTSSEATSSSSQAPAPSFALESVPSSTSHGLVWLECVRCSQPARVGALYNGLHCPVCPPKGAKKKRPCMVCTLCGAGQSELRDKCMRKKCEARFM
jgi:hypothetical protein